MYVVSLFLSVLSGSLLHLFLLQSSPLRAPRDCFSGSYGALSHTWAFIKSLILKDKFEYLYKRILIYTKMLDMRWEAIDNAIHRSKQYRSEVLQQGSSRKFKMYLTSLAKCVECESCSTATQQHSKTALSQSDALPRWPDGQQAKHLTIRNSYRVPSIQGRIT